MAAIGIPERINPLCIDSLLDYHARDQRPDEAHVIDVLSLGWKGRMLAAVVPIAAIAIGIDHYKSMLISQAVELIAGA